MATTAVLLTFGGWFAQGAIQTLLDKASDLAIQRAAKRSGFQDDLCQLRASLFKVQTVLKMAAKRNLADFESLVELMKLLKDAAYDADDFLDEVGYRALKNMIKHEYHPPKASNYLLLSSSALNMISDRVHVARTTRKRFNAVGRVRNIQARLDSAAAKLQEIIELLAMDHGSQSSNWLAGEIATPVISDRETTSFLEVPETGVFGRELERKRIINYLLNSDVGSSAASTHHYISIPVLAVSGIGGVGKTTLAQLVYNDKRVTDYFQLKMWVSVSLYNFNLQTLTRAMIESVTQQRQSGFNSLDVAQSILENELASKKFLLVLDDIWSLSSEQWEKLCALLLAGAHGSKILITSRFKNVTEATEIIAGSTEMVFLEGLEEESYWNLFRKYAFGSHKPEEHPELQAIGKEIAGRLRGSPLLAKVLGSLLRKNLNTAYWKSVLNNKTWAQQDNIMGVLRLSYDYLPGHLKQCFAYCSIFPKDYEFTEGELVYLWIAQGFIVPQRNTRIEDIGKEYLHLLSDSSSFFQKTKNNHDEDIYLMHELIHDLAQHIFEDEFVRVDDDYKSHEKSCMPPHHLSIFAPRAERTHLMEFCSSHRLRTIFAGKVDLISEIISNFLRVSSIRVLCLRGCGVKQLPDNIGDLIHLRYLDISCNFGIQKLPDSICRLYNLQVLNLLGCYFKKGLPYGICNLLNLRQIWVEDGAMSLIANIGKLTSLQNLNVAFTVQKKRGYKIEELKDLMQLHGALHIKALENICSKEEAMEAKLDKKEHVEQLKLVWSSSDDTAGQLIGAKVLEGLRPHENLQSIEIIQYGGVRSPDWLENLLISNLRAITLIDCKNWKEIPSFAQLPFLKVLEMVRLHAVKRITLDLHGAMDAKLFPSLEVLNIIEMNELEEWSIQSGREAFPCLVELTVADCPKLVQLPTLPLSLQQLELARVGVNAVPGLWEGNDGISSRKVSLTLLIVSMCPNLMSLEEGILQHSLPSLKKIYILNCKRLISLPMKRIMELICLDQLVVHNCSELLLPLELDQNQDGDNSRILFSHSFQELNLKNCGQLCKFAAESLRKLTSLVNLTIEGCHRTVASLNLIHLAQLKNLYIKDCQELSTVVMIHLTGIERLKIVNCGELRSIEGLHVLTSLKKMDILECPKLIAAPNLVHSERKLEVWREGPSKVQLRIDDTTLLKLYANSMLSSVDRLVVTQSDQKVMFDGEEELLQNLISLKKLVFQKCNNLQYLPQELHALPSLLALEIDSCSALQSLPDKGLPASLEMLEMRECSSLESLPTDLHILPIKVLRISSCGKIEFLPEKGLPATLKQLILRNCKRLQSLPVELHSFPLETLDIHNCPNIQSLPRRGYQSRTKRYVSTTGIRH